MIHPLVCIVILNYNGWSDTIECLESVLKLNYKNFQIIIVDNNSIDNSVDNIYKWSIGEILPFENDKQTLKSLVYPNFLKPINLDILEENERFNDIPGKIILIRSKNNFGFSAGNNIGIKHALLNKECKYVWILNNDTVLPSNSLNYLVMYSEKNLKTGILGSKLLFYSNPNLIQAIAGAIRKNSGTSYNLGEGMPKEYVLENATDFDYVLGASMLIKREFIEDVGLLCEDYFLYNEEPDWCLRGKQKGWKYDVCQDSIVYHKQGSSTGSSSKIKSQKIDLIGLKSRLLFMKNFFPKKMPIVYFSFVGVILNRILRGQFKRIPKIMFLVWKSITGNL